MGRLYKGKCSYCHETFAARSSAKLLSKMSKHRWKRHKNTMIRKIKAGQKLSFENPTVQDFITALSGNVGRAFIIYREFRQRDYNLLKTTLDALEPYLPEQIKVAWRTVESIHDSMESN